MPYVKVVVPDRTLPHQIIISNVQKTARLTVSCNCMPVRVGGTQKPMMTFAEGTDAAKLLHAWRITKQHRTHQAPFDYAAINASRRGPTYRLA